jgi:folate-binding protein YgfZ
MSSNSTTLRRITADKIDPQQYQSLTEHCGLVDLSDGTQLELRGQDRQQFLHNLCTNDIVHLASGQGCEAMITSVQGKCLGHVLVFASAESLVVVTVPDQAERLLTHFDKYLITEDVQLFDRSTEWGQLLLAGPRSTELLRGLASDFALQQIGDHQQMTVDGAAVWCRQVPVLKSPAYLLACARPLLAELQDKLHTAGALACDLACFHAARIEHGFPWYGWDISEANLPQEVARDSQAINFRKGCYLGQETVARIDALGHVNRLLVRIPCETATVPQVDAPLEIAGKTIGRVTSAAYSPRLQVAVAMAYVRREDAGRFMPELDPQTS